MGSPHDAREMWNELQDHYSQQNGPRIFQLKRALASLTQAQDSVSVSYGKLKVLWDELSMYDPIPSCSCGKLKVFLDRYQRDCVIQFLKGLNESYANTRDQIMLLDPLPAVNKVFSMIHQQEIQHKLGTNIPMAESMALTTRG
ncbi:Retrotransposon gag domain [Dillenia turbinata]|uniref:Retrotransposon gag domain n=1 Tax=Dillenia turbinata TaxID=194707 RepID=A0AAN8UJA2_9MAGN